MEFVFQVFEILKPYFFLCVLIWFLWRGVKGARAGKYAAIAFGVLVQMFSPDPNVQKTVEIVMEKKEEKGKQRKETEKDKK